MQFPSLPRLAFQRSGQFDEASWHSIMISVLRGLAAFIVATAHLRAAVYPALREVADPPLWFQGLAFVSGFAHQAVLVFFVISGWLVGGSLLNRLGERHAIVNYTIDRATRLWTVLIPTFLLTLLIAFGTGTASLGDLTSSSSNPHSAVTFAGNLVGLQRIVVPVFGDNFPLWSLANETWYYVMFPMLAVAFTTRDHVVRLACVAALLLLGFVLPSAMLGYFLVWLLGVAFSRIRIECGNLARWIWVVLTLAVAAYFRLTGELDAFELTTLGWDLVCSLMYLVLLSSLQFKASAASRLAQPIRDKGKFFAEFSFSLYVLHVPLIGLMHHWSKAYLGLAQLSPSNPLHALLYFLMLATLIVAAYLSYLLFESRTYRIRSVLKKRILGLRVPQASSGAVPTER